MDPTPTALKHEESLTRSVKKKSREKTPEGCKCVQIDSSLDIDELNNNFLTGKSQAAFQGQSPPKP